MVPPMGKGLDPRQLLGNAVRFGTVASVQLGDATCIMRVGEIMSPKIPWIAQRAGGSRYWSPPTVGEQGIIFCPEGDMAAGVVLFGIYSNAHPAPANAEKLDLFQAVDGAIISYDAAAQDLRAILPAGATAHIDAPGGVFITGDVSIDGKLDVTGDVIFAAKLQVADDISGDADVLAGDISLLHHKHGNVQAGAAKTGEPE